MQKIKDSLKHTKEYIHELRIRLISSHYLIIILPVIFFLLAVMLYAPLLFSNNDLRYQIEQKISAHTKANLEIKGPVQVALLPYPQVTLKDAILKNYQANGRTYNIYIKKTKIKLSFFASLIGRFSIKKLAFSDAIIEKQNFDSNLEIKSQQLKEISRSLAKLRSQDGIGGNLFSTKKLDLNRFNITNLPNIEIINSKYITYSKLENRKEISHLNTKISFSEKKIHATGNFKNEGLLNNFTLHLKPKSKNNDSYFEMTSTFSNLKIYGSFFNQENKTFPDFGQYFQGTLESEIFNLKNFYKSYVSAEGFVFEKINPATKSIKIKSKILKNRKNIAFENILINSDLISGHGNIDIESSHDIPLIDIKTSIEFLDLDAIWLNKPVGATRKPTKTQGKDSAQNLREVGIDLAKDLRDLDLTFEAKVSQIRYLSEKIKNVDIYTIISKQGSILLLPMTLEIPGKGKVHISGAIENRNNSPKFIGKIDAKGEKLSDTMHWLKMQSQNLKFDKLGKYSLYCDIFLVPNRTILNNIYLNINEQNSELLGEMRIDYHNHSSDVISNFEVHNFDINDYFLNISQNIYFSPGDLLKKLLWLNQIDSKHDMTLLFDKLRYKNLEFKNQKVNTRFGHGYLEIDKLKLESDNFDLETSIAIDIIGAKPQFDIALRSKNISSTKVAPEITQSIIPEETKTNSLSLQEQLFALPSLENFIGTILIDLKNINLSNLKLQNLILKAKLKKGIVNFTQLTGKLYDGDLSFTGSAAIKFEKSLSGNLILQNAKIKPILKNLSKIDNIDGQINIASSISSSGNKKSDFIRNLNSNTKFKAGFITVEKYGLSDLIKKMFNPFYFKKDLDAPLETLYSKKSSTKIKEATGAITVNTGKSNRFKIDFSGPAFNGITSGKLDLIKQEIDGNTNIIFLTGNKEKQIPINIANNFKGKFSNILRNDNIKQAQQYIKMVKRQINLGATEIKFKKKESKPKKKQPPATNLGPKINLSQEQMQMIEKAFPNGIPNLKQQLQNQGFNAQPQ